MKRLVLSALWILPILPAAVATARADDHPATREAVCDWTASPPTIDGKLDDDAWKSAVVIDRFPTFWLKTTPGPAHATRARLLWDHDALYFAGEMTDAQVRSFGTKHNDHLWNGDVFEMFLKPSVEKSAYYEFQVNPRSVVFEVAFPERGAKLGAFGDLPVLGLSAVAIVDGTPDHPGDVDRGWTVEGRIPWSVFAPTGGRPGPGAVWSFAICRYDFGKDGTDPVLMSSAPLTRPSFHQYEDYGRLRFEGPKH